MTHPLEDAMDELGPHVVRMLKRAGLKTLEDVSVVEEAWLRRQWRIGDTQVKKIIFALYRRGIPLYGVFHDFRPDGAVVECEWETGWNKVHKRDRKWEDETWG